MAHLAEMDCQVDGRCGGVAGRVACCGAGRAGCRSGCPYNLAVTAKTSTTVSLSWTAASNATDYTIEYSADAFVTTTMTFFDGVSTGVTRQLRA